MEDVAVEIERVLSAASYVPSFLREGHTFDKTTAVQAAR